MHRGKRGRGELTVDSQKIGSHPEGNVNVPKCINTHIGMAPFTQTCGLCEWEAHRGVFSGGLGVVVPSTVALALLFTTDQSCLREAVFTVNYGNRRRYRAAAFGAVPVGT